MKGKMSVEGVRRRVSDTRLGTLRHFLSFRQARLGALNNSDDNFISNPIFKRSLQDSRIEPEPLNSNLWGIFTYFNI